MMTFLLAAAAAASPAVSADPDVHCMAAYLVAAGTPKDDPSMTADDRAGIQSLVMYYMGKLDARRPGADLKAEIKGLVESPSYATVLRPDVQRCNVEAEARGKYLQSFGEGGETVPAKP